MQDFPDPDAIASAVALREVANSLAGVQCSLAHGGVVGRAENAAMVRYLGLNLRPIEEIEPAKFSAVAMVDTQPGTGNNSLAADVVPDIVIDHHPIRRATRRSPFTDIRSRYGATATILWEYLQAAGIAPQTPLATALIYGIRSDTHDLGRESTQADVNAFLALYPLANKRMLSRIENGQVPRRYFRVLAQGLTSARTFGKCVVTGLGEIESADVLGEVADLLLRNEESTWALCLGVCKGTLWISLRTSDTGVNAGAFMRRTVGRDGTGGGHNASAGGQIPLEEDSWLARRKAEERVVQRFLRLAGESERRGQALIADGA
jgi:nanoRNase/pAp phosphatase (c-di-AMP/oligoRNAs hydrolase)